MPRWRHSVRVGAIEGELGVAGLRIDLNSPTVGGALDLDTVPGLRPSGPRGA